MLLRIVQTAILSFVIAAGISISTVVAEKESIYEILQANGLPLGIFPKGVKEFSVVNGETGRFSVYLNQSCNAKYETELHYDASISGTIGYGQITDLSGISAKELFLWFQVKGIRVDVPSSGLIFFDVGVVRKQYSLSLFETPMDCVAVRGEKKVQPYTLPLYQVDQTLRRNIV
ncbi:unnamed protein product [Thlaspi arvense]|uniref:Uncharacterized protein n=1 Tax=Thlaspi arvense TaxID=13288 RepID=A0AAU9S651_THLAR|nr:unnamed protein product [Thlaspi arvense]